MKDNPASPVSGRQRKRQRRRTYFTGSVLKGNEIAILFPYKRTSYHPGFGHPRQAQCEIRPRLGEIRQVEIERATRSLEQIGPDQIDPDTSRRGQPDPERNADESRRPQNIPQPELVSAQNADFIRDAIEETS